MKELEIDYFELLKNKHEDFAELVSSNFISVQVRFDIIISKLQWLKFYLNEEIDCGGKPKEIYQINDQHVVDSANSFIKNRKEQVDWIPFISQYFHEAAQFVGFPKGRIQVNFMATEFYDIETFNKELSTFYTFENFCRRKNFASELYDFIMRKYSEKQ